MCQFNDRCPVGTHRPGTVCRYSRNHVLGSIASAIAIVAIAAFALPRLDLPLLRNLTHDEPQGQVATVTRVIDGDTITARSVTGKDLGRIRLLGLDAPELDTNDCWAPQARDAATNYLDGNRVRLTRDPKNDNRATYGRLLRYVDLDHDGRTGDASLRLIQQGHAPSYANQHEHSRYRDYEDAQDNAQDHARGLWGKC